MHNKKETFECISFTIHQFNNLYTLCPEKKNGKLAQKHQIKSLFVSFLTFSLLRHSHVLIVIQSGSMHDHYNHEPGFNPRLGWSSVSVLLSYFLCSSYVLYILFTSCYSCSFNFFAINVHHLSSSVKVK